VLKLNNNNNNIIIIIIIKCQRENKNDGSRI